MIVLLKSIYATLLLLLASAGITGCLQDFAVTEEESRDIAEGVCGELTYIQI